MRARARAREGALVAKEEQRWRTPYSCLLLKKTLEGRHGDGEMSGESADKHVSEQRFQPRSRVAAAAPAHFFCQNR